MVQLSHVHACGYFELYYCVGKLTFIAIHVTVALHGTATHACMEIMASVAIDARSSFIYACSYMQALHIATVN